MRYFLAPAALAEQLQLTQFRKGNSTVGYIVTSGDLAVIGLDAALEAGAEEITRKRAKEIINNIRKL